MKKKKVTLSAMVLTLTLASQSVFAGFECKGDEGVSVLVEYTGDIEEGLFFFKKEEKNKNSEVTILKKGELFLKAEAEANYFHGRANGKYSYKFDEGLDVGFSVSEYSDLEKFPPKCSEYSKLPCDYNFVTKYSGHLYLNGEHHDLACEAK